MSVLTKYCLSQEYIDYFISLPEVKNAKEQIDSQIEGKVSFTVNLTPSIRAYLSENIGLDLTDVISIPMRWIKGDTEPHIDFGAKAFQKTYLAYLTDSAGEFIVDDNNYPIAKGCGYIFPEGLKHKTIGTGSEPRLLLGPMSEAGIAVGTATIIQADGATQIIYIRYDVGSGTTYKINNGPYDSISLPLTIENTNPLSSTLKVLFETDIVLGSNIWFIICGSDNIQFGSTSLNIDGTRRVITIDGVTGINPYPGLIRNGTNSSNGFSKIYVYNLEVRAINGSTLESDGGWIGQAYYGKGATDNYIVNCSSNGPIIDAGGGIIGGYAGSQSGASLYITGCSSSGNTGVYSGGIIGFNAAAGGEVICESCWSTGDIIGQNGGGIFGWNAGNLGVVRAIKCYSIGDIIGQYAGGIYGQYAGDTGTAEAINCYSQGNIGTDAGGIFGANAGENSGNTPAINCYSKGTIATPGTGIYGSNAVDDNPTNCYVAAAGGGWNNATAAGALTGAPTPSNPVGNTWVYTGADQPYELKNMGYSPYSLTNIVLTPTPTLNQIFPDTLQAGQQVQPAIPGLTYTILQITGGNPGSYGTITIPNSSTGVLVTTTATAPGTYTIYVRSTGSYNITIFGLIVTASTAGTTVSIPPCCQPICPQFNQTTINTQEYVAIKKAATAIASDVDSTYLAINQNRSVNFLQPAFRSYRDYMTYLQSKNKS